MLACSPAVASVFEFFNGLDVARRFHPEPVTGAEFADLIGRDQPFLTAVLKRGFDLPEVAYPFGRGRYRRGEPLPWILVGVLSRLFDDPDAAFDDAMAWATGRPRRPLSGHYRSFFDWLVARSGREVWIERSGSSLDYLGSLHRHFPDARFVHLHRDGREVALSMREFPGYRLPVALLYRAPLADGAPPPDPGAIDWQAPPRTDDPVTRILASPPAPEVFGRYWSDQIGAGLRAAEAIPADRMLAIRFEDLVAKPVEVLHRLCAFFDLDAERDGWIGRAAALVRDPPPRRYLRLGEGARARLDAACRPGRERLAGGG
jgi:hypothetical protein